MSRATPSPDTASGRGGAADMRSRACGPFDAKQPCGVQADIAKYLAAEASFEAADVRLQTHGGFGFAAGYDVERKFARRASVGPRRSRPTRSSRR